ncbi:MAG TPA: hypothetical protein VMU69_02230 [Bradyrhizobium sp.]|nr:hypothetical protein [Bradyrhizobium sp.]
MERASIKTTSRWPAWVNAAALLLASLIAVASLSFQVRPGTEIVAVAFPPWWSSQQAFEAAASAGAAIVRTTAISTLLVVKPASDAGLNRLHRAGVWLTLDPQAVAACFKDRS